MSGKRKAGLDYAGWSVNIFDGDTKIDKLLEAQGWIGFSIYFYLCQMAYKFDGYFYRWSYDDSASTARRMGGGVRSEAVKETVAQCLQIGLFDKGRFEQEGILTSRGIQRRFYDAIQKRRRKAVLADYWLLPEDESEGLEMCAANGDMLSANGALLASDAAKGKESKEEDRKAKESKAWNGPPAASASTPAASETGFGAELQAAFTDWLAYKREKRQGYQAIGLKSLTAQVKSNAGQYGEAAVAALIRQCMASNWQGIIWEKLEKPANKRAPKGTPPGADRQPSTERIEQNNKWLDDFLAEQG